MKIGNNYSTVPLLPEEELENFKMPFGKFKGVRLYEIRRNYLEWVLETCVDAHPNLLSNIDRFLDLPILPSQEEDPRA